MRTILGRGFAVVALSVALAACGGNEPPGEPTVGTRTATVIVQNQSTSDQRIYVAYAGQEVRLGSVTGLQTARFEIPASIVGIGRELRFVANPLAGQSVASSFDIFVAPGDEVGLTIPPSVR